MVETYGSFPKVCNGSHGFWGHTYTGDVQIGDASASDVVYVVMVEKVGERGNACGFPGKGSVGAERLQGIFGAGGSAVNYQYCTNDKFSQSDLTGCSNYTCEGLHNEEAALMAVLKNMSSDQWLLSWTGGFGNGSGMMYLAEAASSRMSQLSSGLSVPLSMSNPMAPGRYSVPVLGASASVGGVLLEGSNQSTTCKETCIVDTGSMGVSLPSGTCNAIEDHFKNSSEAALVTIRLAGSAGGWPMEAADDSSPPVLLDLIVPSWMYEPVAAYGNQPPSKLIFDCTGSDGMLGLAAMIWYQDIHFDMENKQVTFTPRENVAEELDDLGRMFG
jgi:hypothetical protein